LSLHEVELSGVGLKYVNKSGEIEALKDVDLAIGAEEFVSLIGPSGCGKSTILSLIAGMLFPTAGRIAIAGQEVSGTSPKVGYMLQHDHLLEWRTIRANAFLGLEIRGLNDRAHRDQAVAMLERYGLKDFLHRYPAELSGGMRQRAALARTLALGPEVLLLDEPFSALDYQTRLNLEEEVYHILKQEKKTVILVTHDISEAVALSDRIVVLTPRPGKVKADYRIELTGKDGSPFQARQAPEFRRYFREIWNDLEVRDAAAL
jgi:NitT/TauT family transport system ATP-binding protein